MKTTPYHAGEHVPEAQLEPAARSCPSCGYEGAREAVHRIQDAPQVDLLACPACGICSASRMPTPACLAAYYGRYYDPDGPKQTFAGIDRFARHLVAAAHASAATQTLRVLDFGGGDGAIATRVAALWCAAGSGRDARVTVVDYEAPAASDNDGVAVTGVRELDELDEAPAFDLVIASAILEHVPEVGATIDALFARLVPGGTLYARTPYWAPLLRLLPKTDLTFPGHVHDMGAPYWSRVVATMGWHATLVWSRPSIVETTLASDPVRTLAAWSLKAPAHLEMRLRGPGGVPAWRWVGGWEACIRRDG